MESTVSLLSATVEAYPDQYRIGIECLLHVKKDAISEEAGAYAEPSSVKHTVIGEWVCRGVAPTPNDSHLFI